jgi:hypothetical protein
MAAMKRMNRYKVRVFSRRRRHQRHNGSSGAASWARWLRQLVAASVCFASVLVYSQLLGRDPIPPQNPPPPNQPPFITDFGGLADMTGWTFDGKVLDENPVGLVITFGGILSGHQTTVNRSDGAFTYSVNLQIPGMVVAHTVDRQGLPSNSAEFVIP